MVYTTVAMFVFTNANTTANISIATTTCNTTITFTIASPPNEINWVEKNS